MRTQGAQAQKTGKVAERMIDGLLRQLGYTPICQPIIGIGIYGTPIQTDLLIERAPGVVSEIKYPDEWQPPIEESHATDLRKMRTNTGLFTSATPEWYTPQHIIDRVIALFGEIGLDPCSNAKGDAANVPALNHYTVDDDGLAQPWLGRVYMNPPYGDEIGPWVARLVQAYQSEEITDAIALLPGRTDTAWFQPLFAYPICFVRGRLKFSGSDNSATFPSVIVYLGIDLDLFKDCFEGVGSIMLPF